MLVLLCLVETPSPLPAHTSHRLVKQSTLQACLEAAGFNAAWYLYEEKSQLEKPKVSITFRSAWCASADAELGHLVLVLHLRWQPVPTHLAPAIYTEQRLDLRKPFQVWSSFPSSVVPIALRWKMHCWLPPSSWTSFCWRQNNSPLNYKGNLSRSFGCKELIT